MNTQMTSQQASSRALLVSFFDTAYVTGQRHVRVVVADLNVNAVVRSISLRKKKVPQVHWPDRLLLCRLRRPLLQRCQLRVRVDIQL